MQGTKRTLSLVVALLLVVSLFAGVLPTSAAATDAGNTISPDGSATLAVGETCTLDGTHNSMASGESWSSSDTSIATVAASGGEYDSDATVTAVSAGTATITHTINSMFGSSTETFTITVMGSGSSGGSGSGSSDSYTGTVVSSLTDGDYIIVDRYVSSYSYYALGNSTAGSSGSGYGFAGVDVTVSGDAATVTDNAAIWTWNSSSKSFYNAASGKYLNLPSSTSNSGNFFSSSPVALSFYTVSGNEATVYVPSGNGGYYLNAAYPSNGKAFSSSYAKYINSSYLKSGSGVYFYKVDNSGSGGGEETAAYVTYILYVGNSGSGNNAGVEVARTTVENVSASDLAAQKLKKSHELANEVFGASVTGKEGLLSSDMYSETPTWSGSGPYTVQIYIKKTGQSSVSGAYTLSYNGNGNTSGTAPESVTVLGGKTYTVADKGTLAKTDATFSEWNTQANGNGTSYVQGAEIKITGDTTLYAQWTPVGGTSSGSLEVSKTADKAGQTIDATDTVQLDMEAYATGTTVTVVTPGQSGDPEPVDVLLLLDTSATMQNENRFQNMKDAANEFVRTLAGLNANSKVAVIAYGQHDDETGLDYETSEDSANGLPLWRDLSNNGSNVQGIITGLNYHVGGTHSYGTGHAATYTLAKNAFNSVNDGRKHYVINISDGVFDYSTSPYFDTADAAALKNGGVEIYYITVGSGVDSSKVSTLASAPASTYVFDGGSGGAAIASAMTTIGQAIEIETQSSSTSVTLDKNAVFQDVINTEKFDVSGATATVTIYDYNNGWSMLSSTLRATPGQNKTLNSWTYKSSNDGTLTLNFNANGTITITGFSYRDHYLPADGVEASGVQAQKLHLTVSGLKLRSNAQTTTMQNEVPTNVEADSGIFAKSGDVTPAYAFPVPTVNIEALTQYTYYAKLVYDANGGQNPPAEQNGSAASTDSSADIPFEISDAQPTREGYVFFGWADSSDADSANVSGSITIRSTSTAQSNPTQKTIYAVWSRIEHTAIVVDFNMKYLIAKNVSEMPAAPANGTLSLEGDQLYFKPKTDDYASLSASSDITVTHTNGAKTIVTIIPADNIYYDDDLKNETANQDKVQGYDASVPQTSTTILKNESGTLTFRFTGTRCDVYCTTNANTGWVMMKYYAFDENGDRAETPMKAIVMNNKFDEDGKSLYNVPTLSTGELAYGTYEVVIQTLNGQGYQLDGIRVYNPANNQATFKQVRDLILVNVDLNKTVNGVLFIDTKDAVNPDEWLTEYKDKGPKNEVYLSGDQLIAFQIDDYNADMQVEIGVSAPEAGDGSFSVNNGTEQPVNSVTDMYYTIQPDTSSERNGIVVLKNTGTSLLAITNIKITTKSGAVPESLSFSYDPDMLDFIERVNSGMKLAWNDAASAQTTILAHIWTLLVQSLSSLFAGLNQW